VTLNFALSGGSGNERKSARISTIFDARRLINAGTPPSLEREGFLFLSGTNEYALGTSLSEADFRKIGRREGAESARLEAQYLREMEPAITRALGGYGRKNRNVRVFPRSVIVRDSTLSSSSSTKIEEMGKTQPPFRGVPHLDFTHTAAERMARGTYHDLSVAEKQDIFSSSSPTPAGRFACVNLWRSVDFGGAVESEPLALVEPGSVVAPDDYNTLSQNSGGSGGSPSTMYTLSWRGSHRYKFWYVSAMRSDEALLFPQYDSSSSSSASTSSRGTFHCAFSENYDDERSTKPRPRISVELRAVVFWPDYRPDTLWELRNSLECAPLPSPDSAIEVAARVRKGLLCIASWSSPARERACQIYHRGGPGGKKNLICHVALDFRNNKGMRTLKDEGVREEGIKLLLEDEEFEAQLQTALKNVKEYYE